MDEADALDALADALNNLGNNPYDIALHAEHIRVAQATGMQDQVEAAYDMLTSYWAAGDYAWLPLIELKTSSEELESLEQLQEIQALFERAERDYLSIPILKKHVEFLVDRHARLAELGQKPEEPESLFSTPWTLAAIAQVASKGAGHLMESRLVWDLQRDWALELLQETSAGQGPPLVQEVDEILLARLQQPHSNHDETFSAYSTFTTNYKSPDEYESLLVKASKLRSQAVKGYERREQNELSLIQAGFSLEGYVYYLNIERRAKKPDLFVLPALYERAIAEADRRRFAGEGTAEDSLRTFWLGYIDCLRVNAVPDELQEQIFHRAARSIPGSGELWARYLRFAERVGHGSEAIEAIYESAMKFTPLKANVDQLVPVVLARASFAKRQADIAEDSEDQYLPLMQILYDGMRAVRQASKTGDPHLRLEKYFSQVCFNLANLPDNAVEEWRDAAKHYKTSYLAWTQYTDALIRNQDFDKARVVFKDIAMKNIDWPEVIWDAWVSFEQVYGTVGSIEECLDKVERARNQLSAKRAKEEKAAYEAMQIIADAEQQATATVAASAEPPAQAKIEDSMDVDSGSLPSAETRAKRKAEDDIESESKKPKFGEKMTGTSLQSAKPEFPEQKAVPLKRDRENCTVFVAELPTTTAQEDLTSLFKDCGSIREVKITQLHNSVVATVEFAERDSVPAALTKDKKRIQGQEVAVHLAWRSTLYVTNFPEKTDDTSIRDLFGKYGVIFDIRWPSKKFKSTRRFCYVQYTSPASAIAALELHGNELEKGFPLSVLISNPERKKERTDSDANERELYVAGLSKFVTQQELRKLFTTYGPVKEVRMTLDDRGQSKGFAFVEFEQPKDAILALAANNHELKNRRIAVTLADTRNKPKNLNRSAEVRNRSVRVRNVPPGTQEGLLQQALEKIAPIRRVELFEDKGEAVVELENAAEAGKLLLHTEPVAFNGNTLTFSEESFEKPAGPSKSMNPPAATGGFFVPRTAASRPRAGIGSKKGGTVFNLAAATASTSASPGNNKSTEQKGQGDFRKMLGI